MLCRNWGSDEHFQFSKQYEVQKRRAREGKARTDMIQSKIEDIKADIKAEYFPLQILDQIINYQAEKCWRYGGLTLNRNWSYPWPKDQTWSIPFRARLSCVDVRNILLYESWVLENLYSVI